MKLTETANFLERSRFGDVFCPNPEFSFVGTQRKCGHLRRNSSQDYEYKCWHCSAKVKVVSVLVKKQQLIFKLLCQTGVYSFEKNDSDPLLWLQWFTSLMKLYSKMTLKWLIFYHAVN